MLCAISGETPEVPVASKKSGAIFEKRLIETYIHDNGRDPVTNEELSAEDLVDLRTDRIVRPRPPQFTSIPSLLSAFQNEWDALALERFKLQQELEQTRKELATALYQTDAAVKVLTRVQKERDEARDALSKLSLNGSGASAAAAGAGDAMQADIQALPEDLAAAVEETQAALSKTRRKRPVPEDWATPEEVGSFKAQKLSDNAVPSSRFIAISSEGDRLIHAAGQKAGTASIFSTEQNATADSVESHQEGEISDALFLESNGIAVGTASGAVGVLDGSGSSKLDVARIPHSGEVTTVSVHPSGRFFASTSVDQTALFFRVDEAEPTGGIKIIRQIRTGTPLATGAFHPDGRLYAVGGNDGEVKIYDTVSGNQEGTFDARGPLQSISFSENGIWLAVSVKGEAEIQIWDLRKSAVVHQLDAHGPVSCIRWDYTGQYLAAAGSTGTTVFGYSKASKAWTELLQTPADAVAVAWGPKAKKLYGTDAAGSIFEMTA